MESNNKLITKKDLNKMAWHSLLLQTNYNYERMQGTGFGASLAPTLAKIYGDKKKELGETLKEQSTFMNTTPPLSPFLMGIIIALEEDHSPKELIYNVKNSLFGPLAGLGDAYFWCTVLPLAAGVGASIAAKGSLLGPIVFVTIALVANMIKWPCAHLGYNLGSRAIELLQSKVEALTSSASILGTTVLGGLIASYVSFSFMIDIPLGDDGLFSLQADFFDNIFPNIVPALFTLLIYFLYKKKKIKPTFLIIGILVFGVLCSYLGIA